MTLTKTQKTFITGAGTLLGVVLSVLGYNLADSSGPSSSTPGPTPSSTAPVGVLIHAPAGYSSVVRECVDGNGIYIPQGADARVTVISGDLACPQLTAFPTAETAPRLTGDA